MPHHRGKATPKRPSGKYNPRNNGCQAASPCAEQLEIQSLLGLSTPDHRAAVISAPILRPCLVRAGAAADQGDYTSGISSPSDGGLAGDIADGSLAKFGECHGVEVEYLVQQIRDGKAWFGYTFMAVIPGACYHVI